MKIRRGNSLKLRQKLGWQKVILVTSVAFVIAGLAVVVLQFNNPKKALAATCDSSYALNWSDPTTYTVTCGTVNASNWTVKGMTCFYNSPTLPVGGTLGGPNKIADITVRINQSGNLDGNDTAWVYMYSNDVIVTTFRCVGDSTSAVFSTSLSVLVPSGGTYKISVKCKNDKTNETWQIKNGDIVSCVRTLSPLPVNLASFTAESNTTNGVNLKWVTMTEIDNDYFTLERSANGDYFEFLGTVDGAGTTNSTKKYSFNDPKPFAGMNYYRLTQTDYDGTKNISSVIKVNSVSKTPTAQQISVFPNPFKANFTVKYESEISQQITVRLVGMDGKVFYAEPYQAEEGMNTFDCIMTSDIRSGNYLVQLVSNDKVLGSAKAICN